MSGSCGLLVVDPSELASILEVSRIPFGNTSSGTSVLKDLTHVSFAKQPVTILIEGEKEGSQKHSASLTALNKQSDNPLCTGQPPTPTPNNYQS